MVRWGISTFNNGICVCKKKMVFVRKKKFDFPFRHFIVQIKVQKFDFFFFHLDKKNSYKKT